MDFYSILYEKVGSFLSFTGQSADIFDKNPEFTREIIRIAGYKKLWESYSNVGFVRKDTKASKAVKINLAKAFIDRSVDFLVGNMFTVYSPDLYMRIMAPVLKHLNRGAGIDVSTLEIVTCGSVFGDAFIKVIWDKEISSPRWQLLDPEKTFVVYRSTDKTRNVMEEAVIVWDGIYEVDGEIKNVLFKERWTIEEKVLSVEYLDRKSDSPSWVRGGFFTNIFNIQKYQEQLTEKDYKTLVVEKVANDLGFIPVVHFRNQLVPLDDYGRSDLADIVDLNTSLNETNTQYLDSVNYHGSPTTLIYGAKVGNLKRGVNRIWSGLPKDSRVEQLGGQQDFPALQKLSEMLMDYAYFVGSVPEASSGLFQNISNSTGVALQVQYLPLIGLTKRKRTSYTPGFVQAYKYSLIMMDSYLRLGLQNIVDEYVVVEEEKQSKMVEERISEAESTPSIADDYDLVIKAMVEGLDMSLQRREFWRVDVRWSDYLPKDSLQELEELSQELSMGIESKRGAMKRRGMEDIDSKMREIDDDKKKEYESLSLGTPEEMESYTADQPSDKSTSETDLKMVENKQFSKEKSQEQKSPNVLHK